GVYRRGSLAVARLSAALVGWGSSSIALLAPALEAVLAPCGVTYHDQGRGGETSHHTAARLGAIPLEVSVDGGRLPAAGTVRLRPTALDRKSTRLNSSHVSISYAVFCLKKKKNIIIYKYHIRKHSNSKN